MDIAERLYTEGYISYPRTETTKYPPSFDFKTILTELTKNDNFKPFSSTLLASSIKVPKGGKDVGDHPPITPLKAPPTGQLSEIQFKVYDLVARHFLATLYPECKYKQTEVKYTVGGELFQWSGVTLIDPGYTEVITWQSMARESIEPGSFREGDEWKVEKVRDRNISPP
jgi:DNA topoisomerase-3